MRRCLRIPNPRPGVSDIFCSLGVSGGTSHMYPSIELLRWLRGGEEMIDMFPKIEQFNTQKNLPMSIQRISHNEKDWRISDEEMYRYFDCRTRDKLWHGGYLDHGLNKVKTIWGLPKKKKLAAEEIYQEVIKDDYAQVRKLRKEEERNRVFRGGFNLSIYQDNDIIKWIPRWTVPAAGCINRAFGRRKSYPELLTVIYEAKEEWDKVHGASEGSIQSYIRRFPDDEFLNYLQQRILIKELLLT